MFETSHTTLKRLIINRRGKIGPVDALSDMREKFQVALLENWEQTDRGRYGFEYRKIISVR